MDNHNCSRIVIFKHKNEQADAISLKKKERKKLARKKILLQKGPANLKSAQGRLHSTSILLLCAKRALSIYLMEEVRVANAVSLPSHLPLLPRSPPAGIPANGKHGPTLPSLTDFAAFSSFGSRAWGTSEPGSRPCLAPYPK